VPILVLIPSILVLISEILLLAVLILPSRVESPAEIELSNAAFVLLIVPLIVAEAALI